MATYAGIAARWSSPRINNTYFGNDVNSTLVNG
jgi:hypothetical protein